MGYPLKLIWWVFLNKWKLGFCKAACPCPLPHSFLCFCLPSSLPTPYLGSFPLPCFFKSHLNLYLSLISVPGVSNHTGHSFSDCLFYLKFRCAVWHVNHCFMHIYKLLPQQYCVFLEGRTGTTLYTLSVSSTVSCHAQCFSNFYK